ncbi:hypothetical protein HBI56_199150 [Parastagonospora nodorum]|nr:hypothetical protein HBI13_206380 [Parastagonospora nodorum]KAH4217477.1 hypothetical protein HBI06_214260 [Parastagonospora nodorum]KAH4928239.1 hypothetical protein HBH73_198910 [Parastagonospora nodorum]KAH5072609.1 hypothetical protein HBI73_188160 [Parastagonospora nodorum]KAH5170909.1 hypothetical protein HBH77_227790 [Parastagonospora nodorum]
MWRKLRVTRGIWYLAGMQVQGRAGTTEATAFGHESMAQARNGTIRLSDLADLHARSEAWMRALTSLQGSLFWYKMTFAYRGPKM